MNRIEDRACIVCGSRSFIKLWSGSNFRSSSEKQYDLLVCRACGLGTIQPFPADSEIAAAYPDDYSMYAVTYDKQTFNRFKSWACRMRRKIYGWHNLSRIDGLWKPTLSKEATILDVGCATGMYLYFLKMQGYRDVHGLEMSENAADYGRRMGLDIKTGSISECSLEPDSYDVIRLSHVLEHLPEPKADIHKLVRALRPGGLLLLRLPNLRSVEARIFRSRWVAWDPPRHLYFFTPRSCKMLLENCGLSVVKIELKNRGWDLMKGIKSIFIGKFFMRRKLVMDSGNNRIYIAALRLVGLVLDLLRVSSDMLFVARKH